MLHCINNQTMELCHTLNRGVEKRIIFLDDSDRFRFVHNLFEFNNQDRVEARNIFNKSAKSGFSDLAGQKDQKSYRPRKLLVDVHAFCLMPNHYHLLLSAKIQDGISLFMNKLNAGYAKYFNFKYKRTGTLFESRYKSVAVTRDTHLLYLPYYIHLNPLDLVAPTWRVRKIDNTEKAIGFLESYRWSSFLDYVGKKNFPSVINKEFLSGIIGSVDNYKRETLEWLNSMETASIKDIILE